MCSSDLLFVVFEGGDGVGKSTQVVELVTRLQNRRIEPVLTRQPGGTPIGAKLRKLLLDPGHPELTARTEALVYAADKAQHVEEVILPALVRGDVVVCDRYVDSMIAYQGAGRVLDLAEVEQVARRSEEHTSELQSPRNLVCRLLLEKKNTRQARMPSSA